MKKKNGFLAVSIIFSFFIVFLMLIAINLTSYAQNRILLNQVKKDIKAKAELKFDTIEIAHTCNPSIEECPICIKASSLHGTYGSLVTSNNLMPGNALDCDVNGDGKYESDTERFYYVTESSDDSSYAVLIYYSNTYLGNINNEQGANYTNFYDASNRGPDNAISNLPTNSKWNVREYTFRNVRSIKDENGNTVLGGFGYNSDDLSDNYAARFLTYEEAFKACGNSTELKDSCNYLTENTWAQNNSFKYGYWLENLSSADPNKKAYSIVTFHVNSITTSNAQNSSDNIGVRPVIEVPKDRIEY